MPWEAFGFLPGILPEKGYKFLLQELFLNPSCFFLYASSDILYPSQADNSLKRVPLNSLLRLQLAHSLSSWTAEHWDFLSHFFLQETPNVYLPLKCMFQRNMKQATHLRRHTNTGRHYELQGKVTQNHTGFHRKIKKKKKITFFPMLQACSDIDILNIFIHTEHYKSINTHNEQNSLLYFQSMVIATHQLIIVHTRKSRNTVIVCY